MDLFFDLLRSVIYGVIEGITEWLPISSTGHMILAEQVLKFSFSAEFMEMFRVVIQLGAILEEILAPEQYDTNVATIPGSTQRVEYAIKMPGTDGGTVWLPIDSKFPGDTYAHLQDAAMRRRWRMPAMRWNWCCGARQRISGKSMWNRPTPRPLASSSCLLRGCTPRW